MSGYLTSRNTRQPEHMAAHSSFGAWGSSESVASLPNSGASLLFLLCAVELFLMEWISLLNHCLFLFARFYCRIRDENKNKSVWTGVLSYRFLIITCTIMVLFLARRTLNLFCENNTFTVTFPNGSNYYLGSNLRKNMRLQERNCYRNINHLLILFSFLLIGNLSTVGRKETS